MKRQLVRIASLLSMVSLGASSLEAQPPAADCLIGPQLGATLLYPYFEVETADPNGATTLISINNGLVDPTMARVIVWSDWGNPVLTFDVYLDRFDIVTINLRDVLNGIIPSTADGIVLFFNFCSVDHPSHTNPALSSGQRERVNNMLKGLGDPVTGLCFGENHGDGRARGYITVDAALECAGISAGIPTYTPEDSSYPYFGNGMNTGIASVKNTLYGDIVYVDPSENLADGSEAVAIWADPSRFTSGPVFTFWGRQVNWDGRDKRVPLPDTWDMRFLNGGPFAGGASSIVYHDPGIPRIGGVTCGSRPAPLPLSGTLAATDEDGHTVELPGTLPMSLASRKTPISATGAPYAAGFLQLGGATSQMWVQPVLSARTRFSLGFNATPVRFLCGVPPVG